MPPTTETSVTLEKLLRIKRHEVPGDEFWEQFDRDLERRRLQALVRDGGGEVAVGWSVWRSFVWSTGLLSATALATFAVFRLDRSAMPWTVAADPANPVLELAETAGPGASAAASEPFAQVALVAQRPASPPSESHYVFDVLADVVEPTHFQRIHANPVFSEVGSSGARFVSETFGAGARAQTSFLVDRPRSQF